MRGVFDIGVSRDFLGGVEKGTVVTFFAFSSFCGFILTVFVSNGRVLETRGSTHPDNYLNFKKVGNLVLRLSLAPEFLVFVSRWNS